MEEDNYNGETLIKVISLDINLLLIKLTTV